MLKETITALGGYTILLLAVGKWSLDRFAQRLQAKWTAQYNQDIERIRSQYGAELERLRSELAERRDTLNTIRNSLTAGQAATHNRILEAIQTLWESVLQTRHFTASFTTVYELLLPYEFDDANVQAKIGKLVKNLTDAEFNEFVVTLSERAEEVRPFVGERTWVLFNTYRSLSLRLSWKVIQGKMSGHIRPWDQTSQGEPDAAMLNGLMIAFEGQELDRIIQASLVGAPSRIAGALESKILAEMNRWIFGQNFVALTVEEQQKIRAMLPSALDSI